MKASRTMTEVTRDLNADTLIDSITESTDLTVELSKSFVSVSNTKGKTIYDFDSRKIIRTVDTSQSYTKSSLYSIIGYREAEFRNRLFLGNVMNAVKLGEYLFSLFETETIFGIQGEKQTKKRKIKEKFKNGRFINIFNKKVVVEYSLSKYLLTQSLFDSFSKYFKYETCIHPIIQRRILEHKKVPEYLWYRYRDINRTGWVTIKFKEFEIKKNDTGILPQGYQCECSIDDSTGLDSIICMVERKTTNVVQFPRDFFIEKAEKALQQKQYLNSLLWITEYNLQAGVQEIETMKKITPYANTDYELSLYISSLNTPDKEAALKSIAQLEKIDIAKLDRSHLLNIIKAGTFMKLSEHKKSIELYINALKKNPYIAGAYKDLGDIYFNMYKTFKAWRCWDIARELYPNHSMLKQIDEFEERLVKSYPEYF